MDKELDEALHLLEWLHAEVWTHFDPEGTAGSKKQPKDIKEVMAEVRKLLRKYEYGSFHKGSGL